MIFLNKILIQIPRVKTVLKISQILYIFKDLYSSVHTNWSNFKFRTNNDESIYLTTLQDCTDIKLLEKGTLNTNDIRFFFNFMEGLTWVDPKKFTLHTLKNKSRVWKIKMYKLFIARMLRHFFLEKFVENVFKYTRCKMKIKSKMVNRAISYVSRWYVIIAVTLPKSKKYRQFYFRSNFIIHVLKSLIIPEICV